MAERGMRVLALASRALTSEEEEVFSLLALLAENYKI
jgi:hypothetical protein